jgi:hypothetical protein
VRFMIIRKADEYTEAGILPSQELLAAMIQVKSREEAIKWVKRWPMEDGDAELEIRQLFEADDFVTEPERS